MKIPQMKLGEREIILKQAHHNFSKYVEDLHLYSESV